MYKIMLYINNSLAIAETCLVPILLGIISLPFVKAYPLLLIYLVSLALVAILILSQVKSLIRWEGFDSWSSLRLMLGFILSGVAGFYLLAFLIYPADMLVATIVSIAIFAWSAVKIAKRILQNDVAAANERQRDGDAD